MKEQNNDKKIGFFIIIIVTLILYYGIRRNEENNEKILEMKNLDNEAINKIIKGQIEDDIHLNNSKLISTKIDVEEIKKVILEQEMEKEKNNIKNNNNIGKLKIELWMIETFFLSIFCILIGGLYLYSSEKEKEYEKKHNTLTKNNINNNKYYLEESEMEYLINKDEYENYNLLDE